MRRQMTPAEHGVKRIVQSLTEKDFVETVEVAQKFWDVYRFMSPLKGPSMLALRLTEPGKAVEVGAFGRTVEDIRRTLQSNNS